MTRKETALLACIMCIGVIVGAVLAQSDEGKSSSEQRVSNVLDALHDAASDADGERYFDLFAPDAVFLGTDATERWTIDEFRAYAMKRFETGTGWTYTLKPGTRDVRVHNDIAWFDELLHNAKYGTCRGSGVLRRIEGEWKVEQYVLSFTVPNEAAQDVVRIIRKTN